MPGCNKTTRPRRYAIVLGKVDAGQVDGLTRRRTGHAADFDGRHHRTSRCANLEVQEVIQ
ncbi:hypothetical protein D3C80_2155000 [compost metagenome]